MKTYSVVEIREESPQVKSFFFDFEQNCEPGQFLMVWIPGIDEVPMSVSYQGNGRIGISVHKIGEATESLHKLKTGAFVGLRGPYGKGFELKGREILLVGGGCGSSPLIFLAEQAKEQDIKIKSLVGACNKKEILFKNRFELAGELKCSTDNGSFGYKGFVTDLVERELKKKKYDCVYTCGPEIMMKKVLDTCTNSGVEFQASLERYMKCGLGICGSCALNSYRVCKDGPVFSGEQLKQMDEFGETKRKSSGIEVKI